jgi:serine/threonine protein kinase
VPPLPEEPDEEADLAAAIVDGEASDAVGTTSRDLLAKLEHVRSVVRAFDAVQTGPASPLAMPPPAASWGPFALHEEVGRGGFGVVCRGFDPAVNREIAVKLYSGSELPTEPRLLGQVRHPNVVTVHGAAVHDGRPGIWMEFVHGRTLADRLKTDGPVSAEEAVRIGVQLCD